MESIISQIWEKSNFFYFPKIKSLLLNFFWSIFIFLILLLSFFLGRVTKFMEQSPSFAYESKVAEEQNYELEKSNLFTIGSISTSTIVASKGGKKYYFVWCKGAGNIKESNKRYFNTEELAQKAGYSLAANCK